MATRIRLMNDYAAEWPLWSDEGLLGEDDLPLSDRLKSALKTWHDEWERGFHWERGWYAKDVGTRHDRDGRRLLRDLQAELGPDYAVVLE